MRDPDVLGRASDWSPFRFGVLGLGVAGFACADSLSQVGAQVAAVDASDADAIRDRATLLELLDVDVRLGDGAQLPDDLDVLVVSPGLRPSHPVIVAARERGITVWGELELAWRLRDPERPAPWLVVTGTNGKTTTTLMLESMLRSDGLHAAAAGNIGHSLVQTVMDPDGPEVIAVEVGAPQMPFVYSMSPLATACLNLAEDHVDHFGSFAAYSQMKAKAYQRTQLAAIYNVQDSATERLVEAADVIEGCRAIGFTLGSPGLSMVGVVEDVLVDRAFIDNRSSHAQELATFADINPFAQHNVANALAAAALARAYGVAPIAVRDGLRNFQPAGHRIADAGEVKGVRFIDDSKATNTHAAATSIGAYEHVVWIAGGQAKGQSFDDLVTRMHSRMRAVVLLGEDRHIIREALERLAPAVPLVEIADTSPEALDQVVREAVRFAQPGDVVLLAPGCASWDMFRNYGHRGDRFVEAVRRIGG
ncbi:MAG: UDP-N-acetylmuramoyl-L-alanine--D-glutamate ligase [Candidatus Nanopelagicales bacterium]